MFDIKNKHYSPWNKNPDENIRRLERDASEDNFDANVKLILERLRRGLLTAERIKWAALFDNSVAKEVCKIKGFSYFITELVGIKPASDADVFNYRLAEKIREINDFSLSEGWRLDGSSSDYFIRVINPPIIDEQWRLNYLRIITSIVDGARRGSIPHLLCLVFISRLTSGLARGMPRGLRSYAELSHDYFTEMYIGFFSYVGSANEFPWELHRSNKEQQRKEIIIWTNRLDNLISTSLLQP